MSRCIAIVGRPNVGKSTLFNLFSHERISIVEDYKGVTRDRVYRLIEWEGLPYEIIDTGGIELDTTDRFYEEMKIQALIAVEEADAILFMLDTRDGLTPADREIADILRRSGKNVFYVANKADTDVERSAALDFYRLGIDKVYAISTLQRYGIDELIDDVIAWFNINKPIVDDQTTDGAPRIAVVGRPNVGKSTLLNKLIGKQRMIATDIPGTTRDAIDIVIERNDKTYVFTDTAGIRRRSKVDAKLEKLAIMRALKAIDSCDVAVVMLDATEPAVDQDKLIISYALERYRPLLILVNKWDAVEKDTWTHDAFIKEVRHNLPYLSYATIMTISATEGVRVSKIFDEIDSLLIHREKRISTSEINKSIESIVARHAPPLYRTHEVKLYYATEAQTNPPTFVIFTNHEKGFPDHYRNYLTNQLREAFPFLNVPIKLRVKGRGIKKEIKEKNNGRKNESRRH